MELIEKQTYYSLKISDSELGDILQALREKAEDYKNSNMSSFYDDTIKLYEQLKSYRERTQPTN